MKPVPILEGIAKREGCAVFLIDCSDKIVEAVGLTLAAPKSVLGLKIEDKVPYPTDAQVLKNLMTKTRTTGEETTMILPVYHQGEVHDLRICLSRHGPDHLIMRVPSIIHIRPKPTTY